MEHHDQHSLKKSEATKISFSKKAAWLGLFAYLLLIVIVATIYSVG